MFKSKEFFTYAYLVLLRSMSNDEDERCILLNKIYDKESGGTELICEMNAFMYEYGLNLDYLK